MRQFVFQEKINRMTAKKTEIETKERRGEDSCSTSLPSGNQVDGLPLASVIPGHLLERLRVQRDKAGP